MATYIILMTSIMIGIYVLFGFISFYFATQTTKEQMSKVDSPAVKFLYWHGTIFMPGFTLMVILSICFSVAHAFPL